LFSIIFFEIDWIPSNRTGPEFRNFKPREMERALGIDELQRSWSWAT